MLCDLAHRGCHTLLHTAPSQRLKNTNKNTYRYNVGIHKKTITKTVGSDQAPTCSHARLYRFTVQAGRRGIYTEKVGLTPVVIALSRKTLTR